MNWRSILATTFVTALGLGLLSVAPDAQQPKGQPKGQPQQQTPPPPPKLMKDEVVGSWRLLIIDAIQADGTKVPLFGPNPRGLAIFGAEGRYSLQIMRDIGRPKFAGNDRLKGTAAEHKATVEGIITHFGIYAVNEADKSLTLRIEGSSFPNWDGMTQKRTITALAGDDFTWTNASPSSPSAAGDRIDLAWRRIK